MSPRWRPILLALLFAAVPVRAGSRIHGAPVFDTLPFDCATVREDGSAGTTGTREWFPHAEVPLRISTWQTWIGASNAGKADILAMVSVIGGDEDGYLVAYTAWDHYSDPTGLHADRYAFAPDYILIPPGGGLRLTYICTGFPSPTTIHIKGHVWLAW